MTTTTLPITGSINLATGEITASYTPPPTNVPPQAPTNLTAAPGVQDAVVSGVVPTGTAAGGSPVTSVTVTASSGQSATGPAFPITVPGLTAGVPVTFTATCKNTYGSSPSSAPSAAVTPIAPAQPQSVNWTVTPTNSADLFAWQNFGNYNLSMNLWTGNGGATSQLQGNGPASWQFTSTKTTETDTPYGGPNASRGWVDNGAILQALGADWTTKSGMGIQISALTKCHVKWNISTPTPVASTAPGSRWDALIDTYFHTVANPPATAYYPEADLQIMQMGMDAYFADQAAENSGYYAWLYNTSKSKFRKTIGGNTYAGAIQLGTFNQPGGVTITLFPDPFMGDGSGSSLLWGQQNMVHDLGSIIQWLATPTGPLDDSGNAVKNSSGVAYTGPILNPAWFITVVSAGFEVDFGAGSGANATWATNDFWVSMQNETDPTT